MTTADEVRNAIAPQQARMYDGVAIGDTIVVTPTRTSSGYLLCHVRQVATVIDRTNGRLVLEFPNGCQTLANRSEVARMD